MDAMKNKSKALIDLVFKEIKQNQANNIEACLDKSILLNNCDGVITAYKVTGLISIEEAKSLENELDKLKFENAERFKDFTQDLDLPSLMVLHFSNQKNEQEQEQKVYSGLGSTPFENDKILSLHGAISGTTGANKQDSGIEINTVNMTLENIQTELDFLTQLIVQIVSPVHDLTTDTTGKLNKIIKSVLIQNDQTVTISDIANFLLTHEEEEMHTIGTLLIQINTNSNYKKYFDDPNHLNLKN